MREILFRGKRRDNGEWVEGDLLQYSTMTVIQVKEQVGNLTRIEAFPVDPETISEFTGMTDRNGKKIFEGEIVRTKKYGKIIGNVNVNDYDVFQVVYVPCGFRLERKNPPRGFPLVDDGFSTLEVVGNRWDTPNLLGGETREGPDR